MMRARALAILMLLLAVPVQAQSPPDSTVLEARAREISAQLRCPVCQGLSIQDSPSELAQSMRAVVREQLAQGRTEEEIKASFVRSYGEWVLLRPRATGFNLAVYILPVLVLLAGGVFIVVLAKRWSQKSSDAATVLSAHPEDPDLAAWDDLVPRS